MEKILFVSFCSVFYHSLNCLLLPSWNCFSTLCKMRRLQFSDLPCWHCWLLEKTNWHIYLHIGIFRNCCLLSLRVHLCPVLISSSHDNIGILAIVSLEDVISRISVSRSSLASILSALGQSQPPHCHQLTSLGFSSSWRTQTLIYLCVCYHRQVSEILGMLGIVIIPFRGLQINLFSSYKACGGRGTKWYVLRQNSF